MCMSCVSARDRRLNSDNTPVRGLASARSPSENINTKRGGSSMLSRSPEIATSDYDMSIPFKGTKKIIGSEIANWKVDLEASISNMVPILLQPIMDDIKSLKYSVSYISSKYDEFNNKVIGLEK
ncbi:unnamed protein product [Euphydryas editha]|uniref:Apolipoprotein B n=1 Tax=Euphydryas editha TaxID=104508 RepID=A0AAU9V0D9_EUPED|nr:unnamed protein product [Euphydryas editha]